MAIKHSRNPVLPSRAMRSRRSKYDTARYVKPSVSIRTDDFARSLSIGPARSPGGFAKCARAKVIRCDAEVAFGTRAKKKREGGVDEEEEGLRKELGKRRRKG